MQVYVSEEVQKLDHLRNVLLIPRFELFCRYFGKRVRSLFGVWKTVVSAFIAESLKSIKTFLGCAAGANVLTALQNLS